MPSISDISTQTNLQTELSPHPSQQVHPEIIPPQCHNLVKSSSNYITLGFRVITYPEQTPFWFWVTPTKSSFQGQDSLKLQEQTRLDRDRLGGWTLVGCFLHDRWNYQATFGETLCSVTQDYFAFKGVEQKNPTRITSSVTHCQQKQHSVNTGRKPTGSCALVLQTSVDAVIN